MSLPKRLFQCVALVCVITLFGAYDIRSHKPDGKLHVYFLDIGQGDSALIITPGGKQIMIDGGPDLSALTYLGKYMSFFDRTLDLLILTHPHLDHVASFPEIISRYTVREFLFAGTQSKTGRYNALLPVLAAGSPNAILAKPGTTLDLGDGVSFQILWPPTSFYGKVMTNENNASVTGILRYKNHSIFFSGDDEKPVEQALLAEHLDLHAEVLKVGHHGSKTSSTEAFLRAVHPDLAVISVGNNNSFGHPNQEVLDRLIVLHIPYKRTDRDGTIELTWE